MNKLISFEGVDGCGKTTQINLLVERLRQNGNTVCQTREPGGSPTAQLIRTALLDGTIAHLGPVAEVMMFNAARHSHLVETIRPALSRGEIVITDRFSDSTLAYQGAGGKVDIAWIKGLHAFIVGETTPGLTFILDVPPEVGKERVGQRGDIADRFEQEELLFHQKVRSEFLTIARENPERCRVVDATESIENIHKIIYETTSRFLRRNSILSN